VSRIIGEAFADWRECRQAYDDVLYAQYERAAEATNDRLLSPEGRERGIDSLSLFMGPEVRAMRWASEELKEFWEEYPRVTYQDFEVQWKRNRDEAEAAA
jgi:hypothetical protein